MMNPDKNCKLLFLVPYALNEAPSQRFRFEQYFYLLNQNSFKFSVESFLSVDSQKLWHQSGSATKKALIILSGFLKRLVVLIKVPQFQFIFIHRELAPVGPPVFEWLIAKVFRKKIVYDFDDAIWMTDKTNESMLEKVIRCRSKVAWICKWSYKVSCGNEYLANYARQFNKNVVVNPTTIDTERVHTIIGKASDPLTLKEPDKVVIGWTGSHSTLKYLLKLEQVLQKIEESFPQVSFVVIADKRPPLHLKRLDFIYWNKESEAIDLMKIDIGIMPLPNDEWTKGKCGFKALQYMAMEKPCIASPVGVNSTIIQPGVNGLLADSEEEWMNHLEKLIHDKSLRMKLGKAGRETVRKHYSVSSNKERFLSLFH